MNGEGTGHETKHVIHVNSVPVTDKKDKRQEEMHHEKHQHQQQQKQSMSQEQISKLKKQQENDGSFFLTQLFNSFLRETRKRVPDGIQWKEMEQTVTESEQHEQKFHCSSLSSVCRKEERQELQEQLKSRRGTRVVTRKVDIFFFFHF